MADPNTRQGKRTPVTLKIKFKSETLEQFIERYAVDVSQGGIFIRTKEPLAVGTQMKFEFQLRDASPLIAGEGTVVWTRENDPSRPAIAPGMGVRFDRLAEGSQSVLEKILVEKAKQAPQRSHAESSKPPMFTDTPTRVAPAPIQEKLLSPGGRARSDSEQTPLPKPTPFHSDADEFPEEAFEEATKVRSLDELVAATAANDADARTKLVAAAPADPRAARADSTLADPPAGFSADDAKTAVAERESSRDLAPGLPSPPEVAAATRPGKLLDTTPSARAEPEPTAEAEAHAEAEAEAEPMPLPAASPAKTKLGLEPAKRPTTPPEARTPSPEPVRPIDPASKRPSTAPIWIVGLLVLAGALAAGWYFFLRNDLAKDADEGSGAQVAGSAAPNTGSAIANAGSAEAMGSAGSAIAMVGSAADVGSAGSAQMAGSAMPAGPTENTIVASDIAKATVEVEGTDQHGSVPFTAKLVHGQPYKLRVTAPGYVAQELDVTGGKEKVVAKLVAKPHVVSVKSVPPGARIYIDGSSTGKYTPYDVQLTPSQAARPRVFVTLRKSGYASHEQAIAASAFTEDDAQLTATVEATLSVSVPYHPPVHTASGSANAGSTAGSAAAGSASEAGSAAGSTGGESSTGAATSSGTGDTGATKPDTGATKPATGVTTTPAPSGDSTSVTPKPGAGVAPATGAGSAEPLR